MIAHATASLKIDLMLPISLTITSFAQELFMLGIPNQYSHKALLER